MDQFSEDPLTKLAFTIQANKGVYALLQEYLDLLVLWRGQLISIK